MKESERRVRYLVDEMLAHGEVIAGIVRKGKAALQSDPTNRYAAEHATELIAEAAEKIDRGFKSLNPEIPWDRLRPLRHDVAHPYDLGAEPVNVDQLWLFAARDAPRIARRLRQAKYR